MQNYKIKCKRKKLRKQGIEYKNERENKNVKKMSYSE